ncbi:HNH endonuclease signature motif containing protein, partial [Pseudarthrobacter sp. NPDC058329]|uniref:HNH endonuclease signature motif containing protein n=1 Tax=Pseudarthrobacter sp. NPDC058329 TaxID=3346448 RepID=UPI0036DC6AAF
DGYGPIPPSMARDLVANGAGSFYRVLVDPRDGAPLEIGRTSYRLTQAMKKAVQLRDGRCTFPGCNNPSLDNETDHLTAWQHGGTTGLSNLAQLCPKHHRLKHNSGWTPTPTTQNAPPGWTSPTGRHYKPEHHDWEPPHWPHRPTSAPPDSIGDPPDFVYVEFSPGEDSLVRFLHAPPARPPGWPGSLSCGRVSGRHVRRLVPARVPPTQRPRPATLVVGNGLRSQRPQQVATLLNEGGEQHDRACRQRPGERCSRRVQRIGRAVLMAHAVCPC